MVMIVTGQRGQATHTEMLGPAFRTRTDVWPSMRFAKDVTVPTDCWVNFVVSYTMLVWYIN
jgi:hypothetical protein